MKKEQLFYVKFTAGRSLQSQIKEMLVDNILAGYFCENEALPSCRKLAQNLQVSRNTVVLVYEQLVYEGYLTSRERQGYFINTDFVQKQTKPQSMLPEYNGQVDWLKRLHHVQHNDSLWRKSEAWSQCRYPFIFGQLDPLLFPISQWRECTRQATNSLLTRDWLWDSVDADDPMLIEQLRSRVLPRRGIRCQPEEILVTLGTQQSLYLLAQLLGGKETTLGIENPGYIDVRSIFTSTHTHLKSLKIDQSGLVIDETIDACDYLFITPSHQAPTTVTLPLTRRLALLERASINDQVIIEDDYESEMSFLGQATPAIKSFDHEQRVIYVGSMSKTLAPGLRIGYMVGPAPLIQAARALRRLMLRHPPANNQRTLALFLAEGYHDALVHRLRRVYQTRFECLREALVHYLPELRMSPTRGGSAVWLQGPSRLSTSMLHTQALKKSVFIEPGLPHFYHDKPSYNPPDYFMRLGFSMIQTENIQPGIKQLANLVKQQLDKNKLRKKTTQ
ncbi:PLP-dependent aminotransferase family protein [Zooshikella marina]|uniref:MocR-like pyridoxine biosynthesis transcription factor PdxR n=1 Tax=Zooshikella ganghwensis TaxID=202772 RepID=UPI001BB0197F|nr:PLP-dependent aminotransferase family protein [Zooshikella ganghwensis]MBU2707067.1 PLP-dependent aminotransferase family protein [Zooshikella ganghwensis]